MAWLLCTLHSLRIQMSVVVLCLMRQIRVLVLSTVYSSYASAYKPSPQPPKKNKTTKCSNYLYITYC